MNLGRRRRLQIGDPNAQGSMNALTASGFRVRQRDTDLMRRLIQPWQARSFAYYDQLGEIKYASQFYSRMLSPLKLYAAEINPDTGDIEETNDPDAKYALERIQDPGGGRTGLLGSYGRLMFLTGECYLFVSRDPETDIEQWEMLSTDELRIQSGVYIRYKAPSLVAEEYLAPRGAMSMSEDTSEEGTWVPVDDKEAVAYRLWQRHPRWSMLADSTMQGVLDLCEELLLLTQAVRARARSRLAGSGLLLIDERISPPPLEPRPDENPVEDPFIAALTRAMTLPIVNEGAASQVVPLTLRVPVPENGRVSDLMHHLQIVDPTQLYPETGLRYECIKRIAIGLDMPPEILLGLEQSNHWTAWQIDEQTWKGHGAPKAVQLVDDLTASYYRPYLRDVVGKKDWAKYLIAYDPSEIVNHPDRTADAKDLYDRVVIGKKALREAAGFDEDDAPTEEERAERIGILVRDSSLAWYGEPAPRGGYVETEPGVIVSGQNQAGSDPNAPPPAPGKSTGSEVEKSAPNGGKPVDENVVGSMVSRVMGAADLSLLRAREAAGNRLKSLAKREPESLALLAGVKAGEVAATLGRERVRKLHAPSERELVADAALLIVDATRQWGLPAEVAQAIAEQVEQYAARTLYEKRPPGLPPSFANYLHGVLASAAILAQQQRELAA